MDLFDVFQVSDSLAAVTTTAAAASATTKRATENQTIATEKKSDFDNESDRPSTHLTSSSPTLKRKQPAASDYDDSTLDASFDRYTPQLVISQSTSHLVSPDSFKSCRHEKCFPPNWDFDNSPPSKSHRSLKGEPAKVYPFELDPFQKISIDCLEAGESVLVSAHTSAGKTVIAEYAIAMALRAGQRVIYTSPIKALSNQKYRELYREFKDVGLMTGDVTINPSASCLVMTTEILRNMLYRGSEVIREVAWVCMDEIHYMRNKERGVVWEETMILLNHSVRYVFLSATIPNASEFASWIAKLHYQPCNVVYTDYRPTPLQHFLFPSGGDSLYLAVDEKGNFREDNFQKAIAVLKSSADESKPAADEGGDKKRKSGGSKKSGGPDIYKIVRMIMEREFHPLIVFSFSKRDCETHAMNLAKLDFCQPDEKHLIGQIFSNAIDSLSEDDKKLPQVDNILPLLKRGIGIHHSGLLPILKEVVEILFGEGLLKCLFSTETFSMGLNMPAKSVLFSALRKWDGDAFRMVTSGEYIQMAGRAGRRGLDSKGIVICMVDEELEPIQAKAMMKGQSDVLNSSFHLGYNMLLNLLRVEDQTPLKMISRSFQQFQSTRKTPELMSQIEELKCEQKEIVISTPEVLGELFDLEEQIGAAKLKLRGIWNLPNFVLPFLNAGRIVEVVNWGWAICLGFQRKAGVAANNYLIEALVGGFIDEKALKRSKGAQYVKPEPAKPGQPVTWHCVAVSLADLLSLSSLRLYVNSDMKSTDARNSVGKNLDEVQRRYADKIPLLNAIKDLKVTDAEAVQLDQKIQQMEKRVENHPAKKMKQFDGEMSKFRKFAAIAKQIQILEVEVENCSSTVAMAAELRHMQHVLRRLEHTNAENVIALKGRIAAEISTCDELLATELIFNGVFNPLQVNQTVALCSALIFTEKSSDDQATSRLREELAGPFRQLQAAAKRVAQVKADARIIIDQDKYVEQFKPDLMEVVFSWCAGEKFSEICKLTDVFEGSIIRSMRRLEELLRQMAAAAKSVGNAELESKFTDGIKLIKRDIIFAASLYL